MKRLSTIAARTVILAGLAACSIALPSGASAQQRERGEGASRPRIDVPQQDFRRNGGFAGMLRGIAGARLDRARAADRAGRMGRGGGGRGRR